MSVGYGEIPLPTPGSADPCIILRLTEVTIDAGIMLLPRLRDFCDTGIGEALPLTVFESIRGALMELE